MTDETVPDATTTNPTERSFRVADRVAEQLLARISRGELEPGQRLPGERQLAEQLRVSRVSVRAALQRLKAQGFLKAVQGGGTRVVSSAGTLDTALAIMVRTGIDNLSDLAEIRIALETWAARRAAERATVENVAALDGALARMIRAGGHTAAAQADMDFHLELARAAQSPVFLHIMSLIRDIVDQMQELHHSRTFATGQEELLVNHHRAILRAVATHDGDAAAAAVSEHLAWVLERYRVLQPGSAERAHAQ